MPKVSIAMPVYNGERYLAQAIESLLGQTFGDLEMIISDNASTDATESICRRYAAIDRRVRYVRGATNVGGPRNFNFAFSQCTGQYVKWTTADDYSAPTFIAEAVAVLDAQADVVLCFPRTRIIDADGKPVRDYDDNLDLRDSSPRQRFRELYQRLRLCNAQLGLMRRDAMARTGLMAAHHGSDADFLGEMALLGRFHMLSETLFFRRFHPAASTWDRADWRHLAQYYKPGTRTPPRFELWHRFGYQLRMIWRSPIAVGDKLTLSVDVGRWMRHTRHELWRELTSGLKSAPQHS